MAIVSVNEIVNRRGRLNPDLSREYERVWRIQTNSPADGPATLLAWGGFSVLALPYSDLNGVVDAHAFCVGGIDLQPDEDDPQWWTATAHYSTKLDPQTYQTLQTAGVAPGTYDPGTAEFPVSPGGPPGSPSAGQQAAELNPLLRPPVIDWDTQTVEKFWPNDLDGKPFINSAGEFFDSFPSTTDTIEVLTITRNEPDPYDHLGLADYKNALNSTTWHGYAAKRVRCAGIKAKNVFENRLYYWTVTYTFEIRSKGRIWETKLVDAGFNQIDVGSGDLVPIYVKGERPTKPQLLNGAGVLKPKTDATPAYYRTFNTFNTKDFNLLHLI